MNARRTFLIPTVAALLMTGCSLFDTREPENPVTGGTRFEPPTSPSIVLSNLENAIAYANASDYRRCFGDSTRGQRAFVFEPSLQASSAEQVKFLNWSAQQEEEYIRNVFAELTEGGVAGVSFSPAEVTEVPFGDSVQFTASYAATFPHTRTSAPRQVEGSLRFTFRFARQTNEWYISYWQDIARGDKQSWSLVKARFADR